MRPNSYLPKALKRATILLHIGLLLVTGFASLTSELKWYACDNSTTYAEGSRYSSNLNTVMDYLLHNISQTGFNSTSYGQDPNKVYGLLQCVGNISAEDCSSCSQQARTRVETYCGNVRGGHVWMDYCFLRYNNSDFISVPDTKEYYLYNAPEFEGNHEAFSSTAFNLLSNLAKKAYNPASKGFASASIKYNSSVRVYGLVQCWKDISVEDCRNCLTSAMRSVQNCCFKRQGAQVLFGSCTIRYEIYPFFNFSGSPSSEGSIPPNAAVSPNPIGGSAHGSTPLSVAEILVFSRISEAIPRKKPSKNLALTLGVVGGVIMLLVLCLLRIGKKIKSAIFRRPVTLVRQNEGTQDDVESALLEQQQKFNFRLETLLEATEGFHGNNKLGQGGFGVVYKGKMRDGKLIAVKKLSVRSGQGKKEFTNEVKLVANVQHRNLVKLLGCCVEGVERLLVYEYLANKSLDTFLFDSEKRNRLDWRKRYNIIAGIARGLLYLHEDSPLRIIHRDIKASNILLDDKLNPKIADFGLARLFPEDQTHIHTRIAGTLICNARAVVCKGGRL